MIFLVTSWFKNLFLIFKRLISPNNIFLIFFFIGACLKILTVNFFKTYLVHKYIFYLLNNFFCGIMYLCLIIQFFDIGRPGSLSNFHMISPPLHEALHKLYKFNKYTKILLHFPVFSTVD